MKNNKEEKPEQIPTLTPEQKKQMMKILGLIAGVFSKMILQNVGCEVDYKINGENIEDIKELDSLDIKQRLQLAINEERYEDASQLKKLIEAKDNKK